MAAPLSNLSDSTQCTAWGDALGELADGELGSLCSARVAAHAADCLPCATRLGAARTLKRRLRRIGDSVRAPDRLRESVMASLREVRESRTI